MKAIQGVFDVAYLILPVMYKKKNCISFGECYF